MLSGLWPFCWPRGQVHELVLFVATLIVLTVWAVWMGEGWRGPAGALLAWGLLALGWIDAKHYYLPDVLTLPLIGLGLLVIAVFELDQFGIHLAGALLAYAAFRLINWIYLRMRGVEGLGAGDAKLLAASGAWLGLGVLPEVVLIGALSALVWTLGQRLTRPDALALDTKIPFGAYLAAATWIVWIFDPVLFP